MALSEDRQRQVDTTKAKYGEDHYAKIGSKGGEKSPTKFDSDTGRNAIKARWDKYRAKQSKKKKG